MADEQRPWGEPQPLHAQPRVRHRAKIAVWAFAAVLIAGGIGALLWLFPGQVTTQVDWGFLIRTVCLLVLVIAGLSAMRLKLSRGLAYGAIWFGIVGLLVLGAAYWPELGAVGQRLRSALVPGYAVQTRPHEMMLTKGADGGFSVVGQVNGKPVLFLIDTGASDIVLSPDDARRVGIDPSSLHFDRQTETANGTGLGAPARLDTLTVGQLRLTGVPVSVNKAPMHGSLLGMTFFKRLDSFQMTNDQLVLRWKD